MIRYPYLFGPTKFMILSSIVLFSLAIALGLGIVVLGLRYKRSSLLLAVGHLTFALLGLGFLMNQIFIGPLYKLYNLSALLFFLALFGGLVLLTFRIGKREYRSAPPMSMVAIHAVTGLLALLLLVVGYTKY